MLFGGGFIGAALLEEVCLSVRPTVEAGFEVKPPLSPVCVLCFVHMAEDVVSDSCSGCHTSAFAVLSCLGRPELR